jgi:hypothetical protein
VFDHHSGRGVRGRAKPKADVALTEWYGTHCVSTLCPPLSVLSSDSHWSLSTFLTVSGRVKSIVVGWQAFNGHCSATDFVAPHLRKTPGGIYSPQRQDNRPSERDDFKGKEITFAMYATDDVSLVAFACGKLGVLDTSPAAAAFYAGSPVYC